MKYNIHSLKHTHNLHLPLGKFTLKKNVFFTQSLGSSKAKYMTHILGYNQVTSTTTANTSQENGQSRA